MEYLRVRPLTKEERETLIRLVKGSGTPFEQRRRASVILLSSYDVSGYIIALLLPMGQKNVRYWIRRFNADGLAGLHDRPRPGRPRRAAQAS